MKFWNFKIYLEKQAIENIIFQRESFKQLKYDRNAI